MLLADENMLLETFATKLAYKALCIDVLLLLCRLVKVHSIPIDPSGGSHSFGQNWGKLRLEMAMPSRDQNGIVKVIPDMAGSANNL